MTDTLPTRSTDDDLDYTIDWSAWLASDETITTADVECERGDMLVDRVGHDESTVTFWLSGGTAQIRVQRIAVRVTTSADRTREVFFRVPTISQ